MTVIADPKHREALRALAYLGLESNDLKKAEDAAMRLGQLGESIPELLYQIALLRQKSGEHEQASKIYRQALNQRQKFPEALVNLGHALRALGEEQEARKVWRQAVEIEPHLAEKIR